MAVEAAQKASKIIMDEFRDGFEIYTKIDGSPVTSADLAASKIIASVLSKTNVPIIGEELEKDSYSQRKNWRQHWSVDPLDGTKMFLVKQPEFSVNIAFIEGDRPVFGLIADPVKGLILFGGVGIVPTILNANNNFHVLKDVEINTPITISCSRGFKLSSGNHFLDKIEQQFGEYRLIRKSSSLKFYDLAKGNSDLYPRFAPTMEWDTAAGQAVVEAAGFQMITKNERTPLRYNKENLLNPHFIVL